MSERRSCSALGVERSSVRYISHKADQTPLVMRIRDLAATRTRYGYFRIYILLRREGWTEPSAQEPKAQRQRGQPRTPTCCTGGEQDVVDGFRL